LVYTNVNREKSLAEGNWVLRWHFQLSHQSYRHYGTWQCRPLWQHDEHQAKTEPTIAANAICNGKIP